MRRIRAIHPSAALFVGILLAFTLPFGYSAQACGPSTKEYYGAELLIGHVEPDGPGLEDKEYATGVAHRGLVLGWLTSPRQCSVSIPLSGAKDAYGRRGVPSPRRSPWCSRSS